jgi:hypothetical protein
MAARRWTLEQRKQQAKKIRQWQPWLSSTGAKTLEGKAKSSRNAFKGGFRQQLKELKQLMREQLNELKKL